jgi:hypothetical protein
VPLFRGDRDPCENEAVVAVIVLPQTFEDHRDRLDEERAPAGVTVEERVEWITPRADLQDERIGDVGERRLERGDHVGLPQRVVETLAAVVRGTRARGTAKERFEHVVHQEISWSGAGRAYGEIMIPVSPPSIPAPRALLLPLLLMLRTERIDAVGGIVNKRPVRCTP